MYFPVHVGFTSSKDHWKEMDPISTEEPQVSMFTSVLNITVSERPNTGVMEPYVLMHQDE